jgi:biotin-dependent carboxylase-like uncharacterized protein
VTQLVILRAGPACTVQDAGRCGFLRFGVTPAGPMDWIAHQTANLLAGNPPGAAAIEIGPGGLAVAADGGALRLGISARGFRLRRDGSDLPTRMALTLYPGEVLSVEPGRSHLWAYLSPAGGFDARPVLGSMATHLRSALGPFGAVPLAPGQVLPVARPAGGEDDMAVIGSTSAEGGPVRFVVGPQDDLFAADAVAVLAAGPYRVAPRSDRMAYRLSGPQLDHRGRHDIVSDGVAFGSIQVPGDGLPLVLMADRQPTGGYPKIATVIRADLPRLAQTRPGETVRLAPVRIEAAVEALRRAVPDPARLAAELRRVRRLPGGGPVAW